MFQDPETRGRTPRSRVEGVDDGEDDPDGFARLTFRAVDAPEASKSERRKRLGVQKGYSPRVVEEELKDRSRVLARVEHVDDETVRVNVTSDTLAETPRRWKRSEDGCCPRRVGGADRADVGRPAVLVGANEKTEGDNGIVEGVSGE